MKYLYLILTVAILSSCKSDRTISEEEQAVFEHVAQTKLEMAKQYYKVLDSSDDSGIVALLTDSIVIIESEYDYEETFSQERYAEWLKWDSVFDPAYEVLQIEQENEVVKAKISKTDKRISFLHQQPIVTNEVIRFDNDRIISVEKTKYVVFDETTFVKNRESLVNWIDHHHPELKGFIHDQTKTGGMKYLKAIELYNNR